MLTYACTYMHTHAGAHIHACTQRTEEDITLCPLPLRNGLSLSLDLGWQPTILMILLLFFTSHSAGVTDTGHQCGFDMSLGDPNLGPLAHTAIPAPPESLDQAPWEDTCRWRVL